LRTTALQGIAEMRASLAWILKTLTPWLFKVDNRTKLPSWIHWSLQELIDEVVPFLKHVACNGATRVLSKGGKPT